MKPNVLFVVVVVAVICSVSVVQSQFSANFAQVMQQCMQETQVTEAELKDFMANGMQGAAKESIKCYAKCLMVRQGHMINGQFNAQAMLDSLKDVPQLRDKLDEISSGVEACKAIKGTNDCDTAFKITMCLKEHKAMAKAN